MAKINIEIEDTLPDRVEVAIDEVKEELIRYLNANNPDMTPDLNDLGYSGTIHEIVDGCVPVYTHEIETAWYLHSRELQQAYFDAGVGDNPRENDGMAAIYYYIDQQVSEWYDDNADDIMDTFEKEQEDAEKLKEEQENDK
jgi:hypothetical protein